MRISSINLKYSQNIQLKKAQQHTKQNSPSFGKFESEEVKKLTYETAIRDYEDWSETKKKNFGFYDLDLKFIKENMGYFDNTNLATVKKWNGSDGKEYAYIALNRAETDKHEHKELFNDIVENAQSYPIEIEEEIIAKDPDFVRVIEDDSDLMRAHKNLHNAEIGFVYKPSESDNNSYKQEEDLWMEAVSREILN